MVIESVVGNVSKLGDKVHEIDLLELGAELRTRPHFRMRTQRGREVVVSMPRGSELQEGDVLNLENGVAVVVKAAPEDLLEVRPRNAREWGVTAYQLGNLHREVKFLEDRMLSPYEESTEQVLHASGVPYARVKAAFVGDRYGAYTGEHTHNGQSHHHHHGHGEHQHA